MTKVTNITSEVCYVYFQVRWGSASEAKIQGVAGVLARITEADGFDELENKHSSLCS